MKADIKSIYRNLSYKILLVAILGICLPGFAQNEDEEVYDLDPFNVTDKDVFGYSTIRASSASRIAIPITDISGSVVTINEQLIEDLAAVNIADTFNFVSGVSAGNAGGGLQQNHTISLRGYTTTGALRDGIPDFNYGSNGGFDYSMLQRVEIVKGPAGVQFGQHNQGGVINMVSKRPLPVDATKTDLMVGSFDFWRASVDHSTMRDTESGKTGFRISAAITNTNGPVELASETSKPKSYFVNPSFSHTFDSGMQFWAAGYFVDDNSSRVSNSVFMFGTPDGRGAAIKEFAGKASVVVQNLQFTEYQTFEAGIANSFDIGGARADMRVVARTGNRETSGNRTRANGGTVFIDKSGNQIPDGSPSVGRDPNMFAQIDGNLARFGRQGLRYNSGKPADTDWSVIAADMNLSFDIGETRHNLLLYTQLQNVDGSSESLDIRVNNTATLPADIRSQFNFDTGIEGQGIVEIWPNPPAGLGDLRSVAIDNYDRFINRGTTLTDRRLWNVAVIDRVYLLDDNLILSAGVRRDEDENASSRIVNDQPVPGGATTDSTNTANYGLLYKVLKDEDTQVSVFYNNAETFVPEFGIDERLATFGAQFPNRTVETDEIGFKVNALNNTFVATVAYFDTTEQNVLVGRRDEDGSVTGVSDQSYNEPAGNQTTSGIELDLAINPSPEWNILLSYADTDSNISEDALPLWGVPDSTFAALVKYSFNDGPLEGFSIVGMYNYWGESVLNRASNFNVPSGDKLGLVLAQNWGKWTVRLRVDNLEDNVELLPSQWWTGVGATWERNWRLSAGYTF
jgi:outer membrane receptor protein involved in Fe transport